MFRVVPPQAGFIAFVFRTDRQETAVGIAEVNHHRLVVARTHLPDWIEARIICLDVGPVRILEGQPYILPDLQSLGPGFEAALQLGSGSLGPALFIDAVIVQASEVDDAVLVGIADFHRLIKSLPEAAVHIGYHRQVGLIHHPDRLLVVLGRAKRPAMKMNVDRGKLGAGNVGPGEFHQGLRHGGYFGRRVEIWRFLLGACRPKCKSG